ncbi:MAG: hypothetical protein RLZZ391_1068 [Bacteroidota bacterium]|jgi:hypothetical protein
MKNLLFFFSFTFLLLCKLSAQKNTISTTGKWGQQLFISDVNGQAFINKYEGIVGNVYDQSAYQLAKITLKDGRVYNDVKARINLLEHEVNFIASNGQEGYLGKGMASEIAYTNQNDANQSPQVFQCGFPPIDNQNRISFYQILVNSKTSLLKSVYKSIQERNNDLSGERYKEFATYENMYLLKEGVMTRVKKDKSSLLVLLKDQEGAIKKYIEDQKLNLKNEAHLIALVKYYNTL